jgi:pimeloyl-ACP methyl ester carboxylesterase
MRRQLDGLAVNYEVDGQGKTLVLLHGLGGNLDFWAGAVPRLRQHFQVLRVDVAGFGKSDRPEGPYSLELWAEHLAKLLRSLDIERAIIMGLSMGGAIVQRFGLDYPELTEALVILSTSSEVNESRSRWWEARAERIESGVEPVPEGNDPRAYAAACRAVGRYNMTRDLARITVPVLVMVGEKDTMTPPGGSVIISRNIPGAELHILKDCGHHVFQEKPEEAFEILYRFFWRHGILPEPA